jgi:hypothetical protein
VTFDLSCPAPGGEVTVQSFPSFVSSSFATPGGANTTTVSLNGTAAGRYYRGNGGLELNVPLLFDQSVDVFWMTEDSTLPIYLSTNTIGTPFGDARAYELAGNGSVQLVGQATFVDGVLGGSTAMLGLSGTFTAY